VYIYNIHVYILLLIQLVSIPILLTHQIKLKFGAIKAFIPTIHTIIIITCIHCTQVFISGYGITLWLIIKEIGYHESCHIWEESSSFVLHDDI